MTRDDLCSAVAALAKAMACNHEMHGVLIPAFTILVEALAECINTGSLRKQPRARKQARVERLAQIEASLHQRTPAERMRTVMDELQISRAYYFELRAVAIEQRLLENQSTQSTEFVDSRTASGLG